MADAFKKTNNILQGPDEQLRVSRRDVAVVHIKQGNEEAKQSLLLLGISCTKPILCDVVAEELAKPLSDDCIEEDVKNLWGQGATLRHAP